MNIIDSIRDDILSLDNYKAGRSPKTAAGRKIKLSSNENRFGVSSKASDAVTLALKEGLSVYPDSRMVNLKNAVVGFWKRRDINITVDNLIFGDGSGEVLNLILAAFLNDGDKVVIPEHSFILYRLLSIPKGAEVIEVKRRDFAVDLDKLAIETANRNAKVVIFSNPDNPTSTFADRDKIKTFLDKIPETVAVVLDEAYIHFAGLENSCADFVAEYPNLIITHTFSKAYGLAGLRVGYGIMSSEVAVQLEKIRLPFNLGALQQAGASAALEDEDFLDMTVRKTAAGRDFILTELRKSGITVLDAYGNFVFADFGDSTQAIWENLERNGITVRMLSDFGFGDNFVRITVGTDEDNGFLIEKIREVLL
jgi:histidinol-phosphate aminotransferase